MMLRSYLALALLVAALSEASPAPATTQTFALSRRDLLQEDGTLDENALLHMLDRTLIKYNHPGVENLHGDKAQKRGTSTTLALTDQVDAQGEDELYFGRGKVGKTEFTFDFDTGSADLWVPGPNCKDCGTHAKYDNKGADQKHQASVTYGSGLVSGEIFKDTVNIGGLCADNQDFISVDKSSGFQTAQSDGLMGMAFSAIAKTKAPTFFENLMKQNRIKDKEFSFYLGRAQSKTESRSSITLGGRDPKAFYGKVTKCPVTSKTYWQIDMQGAKVDGKDIDNKAAKGVAAIDTGTSIVLAPNKAIQAIMSKVPGAKPIPVQQKSLITMYAFPCNLDKKFVPSLRFGGQDFAINPIDFNMGKLDPKTSKLLELCEQPKPQGQPQPQGQNGGKPTTGTDKKNEEMCAAGIAGVDLPEQPDLYVVGDVFLKNWYSIFSYDGPSVSFAAAVGNQ